MDATTGCDLGAFKAGGQAGTSIAALKCLLAVSLQADFHTRTAAVSYNDFELLTGLSRPMISKGLRMLADMQILTIAGDHAHRYTVNEWATITGRSFPSTSSVFALKSWGIVVQYAWPL
ncbi:hypothetical protein [Pseudomonas aeruginosa]|uniref:hypothetical protein n=1 Tax=Pseudomonas aeruginosa TaxID=287 RepID=UPI00287FA42F|nr:hypothetical protein [Pseudomonas aeruginosa]